MVVGVRVIGFIVFVGYVFEDWVVGVVIIVVCIGECYECVVYVL